MSLSTQYSSTAVDSEQIRVVHVEAGRWNDPIRCKLRHRRLDDASKNYPYKALSYVWGSSMVTETIYLEGDTFQITLNISCALRHLRKVDQDISLWVDSLCINQQDHQERSIQVGIMQLIYTNAEEVVVFIGDDRGHRVSRSQLMEPPSSPMIILYGDKRDNSFFTDMLNTCQSNRPRKLTSSLTAAACSMGMISLFSDLLAVNRVCKELMGLHYLFECLKEFVVCPWWSRIWVVQEVAVATAVTVRYGTITMYWDALVATADVWSSPETRLVATSAGIEPENLKVFALFTNQLIGLEQTRRKWRTQGGTDLARLLQEFSDRQATDDRDKVYGLLGLAKQDQHDIEAAYGLDVSETYRVTALTLIGNRGSLACWCGDQKRKFHRGLPSWVPDWSTAAAVADKRRLELFHHYRA
ncbi:heterokaryon incompatibility protein-domain-containing protein, partial [Diaporthe sp. PMI_573]